MAAEEQLILRMRAEGGTTVAADMDKAAGATRRFHEETNRANVHTRLLVSSMGRVRAVASVAAGGLGILGAVTALQTMIKEARESAVVSAQTAAVIKSTGGAAHLSAAGFSNLANQISSVAGIDDEAIQSMENVLATFTSVQNKVGKGNDIFNQATRSITDMSVALGLPLNNAAIMVGKALQDPINGMNAMRRVGVNFSKAQVAMVGGWVKHGQILRAQRSILHELNTEFGGSAKAQADPLKRLDVVWRNFLETLGGFVLPVLNRVVTFFASFVNKLQSGQGVGRAFHDIVRLLGQGFSTLWGVVKSAYGVVMDVVHAFQQNRVWAALLVSTLAGLLAGYLAFRVLTGVTEAIRGAVLAWRALNLAMRANPIILVISLLVAIGVALVMAYNRVKWFRDGVNAAWAWIKTAALDAVHWIIHAWNDMVNFISSLPGRVSHAATGLWNGLKAGLIDAVNWIIDKINAVIKAYNSVAGSIPIFGGSLTVGTINPLAGPGVPATGGPVGNSTIGHRQAGGPIAYSGMYRVGESGPEDVYLPSGGHVVPASPGQAHVLEGTIINHIDGREVGRSLVRVGLQDKARQ